MNTQKKTASFVLQVLVLATFLFGLAVVAQAADPKYDGTLPILDAPLAGGQAAVRYSSDGYVVVTPTATTIKDCVTGTVIGLTSGELRVNKDGTGYWCFTSTAAGPLKVRWTETPSDIIWLPDTNGTGYINVKDFGAAGDGSTDDTTKIKAALIYAAAKDGGRVYFPHGIYKVTDALTLPSGVVIEGVAQRITSTYWNGFFPNSPSQILLTAENKSIFRIGENCEGIRFRDIEFRATSTNHTYGVEAVGKLHDNGLGTTQDIAFDNVAFTSFEKGIYAHMPNRETDSWQFDYVKVEHSMFTGNVDAGIYMDVYNTDWAIKNSNFYLPPHSLGNSDAIRIRYAGAVYVQNTFAGGIAYDVGHTVQQGGDFIDVTGVGSLTITNCSAERLTRGLVWAEGTGITGNLASTINVFGGGFGDPVELYQPVNYVSNGVTYFGKTVRAFNDDVRFYSTGDRFCYGSWVTNPCYDISTPPPAGEHIGFQGGKLMFQTGQLQDGAIPAVPTTLGNDTQIVSDSSTTAAKPVLNITTQHVPGQNKTFLQMEQTTTGGGGFNYQLARDGTNGYLRFTGSQGTPWTGYIFNGPVVLPARNLAGITPEAVAPAGSVMFCLDCLANSSPCATGGSGALAIQTGTGWICK
jgi:hypothetical protein